MKFLVLGGVTLLVAGCGSLLPSASQLKALSDSQRSWCVQVNVPGMGQGRMSGTGIQNGKVECTESGMTVETK